MPDPLELNRSLQRMEAERGFAHRYSNERAGSGRGRPRTAQRVHVRRAEREIAARGGRSWVADIRGRVEAARAVSRREGEFRSALAAMGVELSDASPRGGRRDWVYSLAGTPSRRVRGEGLGLEYGRAAIEARWAGSAPPALPREEVERVARSALEVEDLAELDELARAVGALERYRVRGATDLERRAEALEARGDAAGAAGGPAQRPAAGATRARGERREGREGEPMVVEVSYADGREDVFDLERLCEGRGQPLATEYRLRFDRMESGGLWVEANSYGPGEGGVADRRRGWRLMLASPEEVRSIESVSRDGRLRYWRLGGSLVDDRRLSAAEQRLYEGDPGACLLRRALWLDGAVSRARPDLGAEEACALYGFTLAAREEAAEAVSAAGEGV